MSRRWSLLVASFLLASCGKSGSDAGVPGGISMGAPPTEFCGTVLNDSAAGASVYDVTQKPIGTVDDLTVGGLIFVRAAGCEQGDSVNVKPATAGQIIKTAPSADGLAAAVVIKPTLGVEKFDIVGTGANPFDLPVSLSAESASHPPT
jgi:hypothetical protein